MCSLLAKNYDFDLYDQVLLESNGNDIEFGDIGEIISIIDEDTYKVLLEDNNEQIISFSQIICIV